MAQRKLRPFAEILILVNSLTDEQKADLLDVLRGKPTKKERKTSKRAEKPPKEAEKKPDICVTCGNEEPFFDHKVESPVYHKFRTSLKTKAATESK